MSETAWFMCGLGALVIAFMLLIRWLNQDLFPKWWNRVKRAAITPQ